MSAAGESYAAQFAARGGHITRCHEARAAGHLPLAKRRLIGTCAKRRAALERRANALLLVLERAGRPLTLAEITKGDLRSPRSQRIRHALEFLVQQKRARAIARNLRREIAYAVMT